MTKTDGSKKRSSVYDSILAAKIDSKILSSQFGKLGEQPELFMAKGDFSNHQVRVRVSVIVQSTFISISPGVLGESGTRPHNRELHIAKVPSVPLPGLSKF